MKTPFVGFCSRGGGEPDPGGCGRKRRRDSRREKKPATEKDAGKREKTPENRGKSVFRKKYSLDGSGPTRIHRIELPLIRL